ncbi:transposase [Ligilactobacillus murinus]|uniref:transposase n=1 Tax=Ligilactobacillus murinus TaxID=1622 RepID=UPI000ACF2328
MPYSLPPLKYEPRVLLKLVLLAYSYGIFSCRKIELIFGNLKAYLGFIRFTVRNKKKVNRQMGIALMALNMWKISTSSSKISPNNKNKKKTIRIFQNFQKIRMVFFKDRALCHSPFYLNCISSRKAV